MSNLFTVAIICFEVVARKEVNCDSDVPCQWRSGSWWHVCIRASNALDPKCNSSREHLIWLLHEFATLLQGEPLLFSVRSETVKKYL